MAECVCALGKVGTVLKPQKLPVMCATLNCVYSCLVELLKDVWCFCFSVEGYSGVVEPSECIHISEKAKAIAKVLLVLKFPYKTSIILLK